MLIINDDFLSKSVPMKMALESLGIFISQKKYYDLIYISTEN
jgi:hypothetical protein